jgi:thiol-disulfide isomerase/thioredoxin
MDFRVGAAILLCSVCDLALPAELREANSRELEEAISPSHLRRPRLVHVWASWCTPCVAEMPRLLPELRKRRGSVDTVLVSLDGATNAGAASRLLRRCGGAPGANMRARAEDAMPAIKALDAAWDGSLPATYLISREGTLLVAQRGITDLEALLTEVDRAAKTRTDRRTSQ